LGEEGLAVKDVVWKVYEKVAPSIGMLVAGPVGALAASTLVVSTWLLARSRGWLGGRSRVSDEELLASIYAELRRAERRLEEARSAGAPGPVVKALEDKVEWLREEYRLAQVRIAAKEALEAIGGRELVERLDSIVERLERGDERAVGEVYDVLVEVERLWRSRRLEADALQRLLSRGGDVG